MGILLAIFVAIFDSLKNVLVRKSTRSFSSILTAWSWQAGSLLILIPALIFVGVPPIDKIFWIYSSVKVILFIVAMLLYATSLKKTDMSLALPMLALTPLVTSFVSLFLSSEFPTLLGGVGIIVIILGTYLLNLKKGMGILTPFKNIFINKGVFYMFLVAMIYGVSTSVDKAAVVSSSPIFYSAYVAIVASITLTPAVIYKHRDELKETFTIKNMKVLLPLGLVTGIIIISQMTALNIILAAYVIAIKRTSIVISVVLAYFLFNEKIKDRLGPIIVMLVGLLMIIFS